MRPSAVYRPSGQLSTCQPQYRVCQCEPAAVWHGQSCRRRRRREQQTFVGAENDVAGCCLVAGCRGAGMAVGDNCESGTRTPLFTFC